jgi:hypothetical protein
MRLAWFGVMAAACGGGEAAGPPLVATTSFTVTTQSGVGTSPLDALYQHPFSIQVVFPSLIDIARGSMSDTAECKSTTVATFPAERTASGESAELVQTEILDMLAYWDLRLQLCTTGESSVILHSEIPALNLAFGCFGIPPGAVQRTADGYPQITSFTATRCNATILDVVNNRILGNDNFEVMFETDPATIP